MDTDLQKKCVVTKRKMMDLMRQMTTNETLHEELMDNIDKYSTIFEDQNVIELSNYLKFMKWARTYPCLSFIDIKLWCGLEEVTYHYFEMISSDDLKHYVKEHLEIRQFKLLILSSLPDHEYHLITRKQLRTFLSLIFQQILLENADKAPLVNSYLDSLVNLSFFFLQESKLLNRIFIADFLRSPFLTEIRKLYHCKVDEEEIAFGLNWFGNLKYTFEELVKRNEIGMIGKEDFIRINDEDINPRFIEALFNGLANQQFMSLDEYLLFQSVILNLSDTESIRYLFRIFAGPQSNYISISDLEFFLGGMFDMAPAIKLRLEFIAAELSDIVTPRDSERISLCDLLNCEQAEDFLKVLIFFQSFMDEEDDDEEEEQSPSGQVKNKED